jgi:hypothetical protein
LWQIFLTPLPSRQLGCEAIKPSSYSIAFPPQKQPLPATLHQLRRPAAAASEAPLSHAARAAGDTGQGIRQDLLQKKTIKKLHQNCSEKTEKKKEDKLQ